MGQINKLNSLIFLILLGCSIQVYSQEKLYGKFTVNNIDSSALEYYYIVKISTKDSIQLNILSEKHNSKNDIKGRKVKVGKKYNFVLKPIYEIVDKRHGKDSVFLSPATMRSVTINGETFISSDYSIHPFKTKNLIGLYYVRKKCKGNYEK